MSELEKLVTKLTTGGDAPYAIRERAIALFEFQVELVYPGRRLGADFEYPVDMDPRDEAAMFATVKLLEEAQAEVEKRLGREPTIQDLTEDHLFAALYNEEFVPQGGFGALRYNRSAATFDKHVKARWDEAEAVADLIDVSCRFKRGDVDSRHKGGIVFAREYVARDPEYASRKLTVGALQKLWNDYSQCAGFLYLILRQGYLFRPPPVTGKRYVETLLEQASDPVHLSEFFAAYRELRGILVRKGQAYRDLPKVNIDTLQSPPLLVFDPLPPEGLLAFGMER